MKGETFDSSWRGSSEHLLRGLRLWEDKLPFRVWSYCACAKYGVHAFPVRGACLLYDLSANKARKMYGSRKVKVKFAKSTWDDQLKGIGFSPGTIDRDEMQEKSPMAPPSPLPPSPAPPSPQAADFDFEEKIMGQMKEDEFTRHAREQTKAQLESITGRMFQVLIKSIILEYNKSNPGCSDSQEFNKSGHRWSRSLILKNCICFNIC